MDEPHLFLEEFPDAFPTGKLAIASYVSILVGIFVARRVIKGG
jgi:hypothetical protein